MKLDHTSATLVFNGKRHQPERKMGSGRRKRGDRELEGDICVCFCVWVSAGVGPWVRGRSHQPERKLVKRVCVADCLTCLVNSTDIQYVIFQTYNNMKSVCMSYVNVLCIVS